MGGEAHYGKCFAFEMQTDDSYISVSEADENISFIVNKMIAFALMFSNLKQNQQSKRKEKCKLKILIHVFFCCQFILSRTK